MKSIWLRTVALPTLIATPAIAADLPVKAPPAPPPAAAPAYDWTGFHIGLNAGADWARSGDPTTSASCAPAGFFGSYFACGDIPAIDALGSGSMSGNGFTGGAQAGYDWQFNSTVVGIEADVDAFHARASRAGVGTPPTLGAQATITNSVAADWLFTARGRLGWAFSNNILAYATGGLAVTRLNASNSYSDVSTGFFSGTGAGTWNVTATKAGWTVGGGLEWALTKNWSARAEYLYVHFDPITASGVVSGTTGVLAGGYASAISTSTDLSAQIARAGINYKF